MLLILTEFVFITARPNTFLPIVIPFLKIIGIINSTIPTKETNFPNSIQDIGTIIIPNILMEKTNEFTPEEARFIDGDIVIFKIND